VVKLCLHMFYYVNRSRRKDELYANKTHGVYQHTMLVHAVPHCLLMRCEVVLCQFHRAFGSIHAETVS
jgi:hypothetical protein